MPSRPIRAGIKGYSAANSSRSTASAQGLNSGTRSVAARQIRPQSSLKQRGRRLLRRATRTGEHEALSLFWETRSTFRPSRSRNSSSRPANSYRPIGGSGSNSTKTSMSLSGFSRHAQQSQTPKAHARGSGGKARRWLLWEAQCLKRASSELFLQLLQCLRTRAQRLERDVHQRDL